jgi:hypothetical protein
MTTCTKAEYAQRKGVSRPAISQAIRAGRVVVLEDGRVDIEASDRVWDAKTDTLQSLRANAPKRRAQALADEPHRPPPPADRAGQGAAASEPAAPLSRVIYDFESARAKRETHAANIAEMEERKRAGELCETSAVLMTMTTIGSNFRTALERVADKLADRVAAETDPHACHQIISAEITQALEQLAKDCEAAGRDLTGDRHGRE